MTAPRELYPQRMSLLRVERTGRMAPLDIGWTPGTLRDVSMALSVSLGRVPKESLQQTAVAENWHKASVWLLAVQQLTAQADEALPLNQVPPFPLTAQELRALQASIDRIAQARAAASPTRVGPTSRHLHRSLGRVMWSAYGLGAVLVASAAITVIDLTLVRGERTLWYVGLSVAASGIAIGLWILHFLHLGAHKAIIEEVHPRL